MATSRLHLTASPWLHSCCEEKYWPDALGSGLLAYVFRLVLLLRSPAGASVCSTCSASSCSAGQYLSGCGGSSAGTCTQCAAGSYSISTGKHGLQATKHNHRQLRCLTSLCVPAECPILASHLRAMKAVLNTQRSRSCAENAHWAGHQTCSSQMADVTSHQGLPGVAA